ncbi:AAA family ATPase [Rhizobium sp. PL01]|uniref:AAA family ATPase n=1 Tax=Rhizobium sp. PL01 TaxID=3085631 RepID=UPI00298165F4|nr:AAA family ATPase [Rhizobium sp. PL01]MDW5316504.1 AAA family ATPase [Rhizobium sp. PL01]
MKLSYSVENLRRLSSIPMIEIRPLTILLGRNSAGKSTFLRSLPLLRQSIETKSSAPILWYGDFVDFGNYRSAVADNDTTKKITFSFEMDEFSQSVRTAAYLTINGAPQTQTKNVNYGRVKALYSVRAGDEGTDRHEIAVKINDIGSELRITFGDEGPFASEIALNGREIKGVFDSRELYFSQSNIFSTPSVFSRNKDKLLVPETRTEFFRKLVEKELGNLDQRIGKRRILSESSRILQKRMIDQTTIHELAKTDTQTFHHYYLGLLQKWRQNTRQRLDDLCKINHALNVLEALSSSLATMFRSVEYIGPARARSERFYRQQELEVAEISPDGRNLPMFLASLDRHRLNEFSNWVERIFGYGVSVHKTEGHISINLDHGGKSINVLDTGYGVSQVLPVLTQIWWMQHPRRPGNRGSSGNKTLLIEQPELHLHPAHQALLADVFVEALSSKAGFPISFIVETHSESLVNKIGELISKKALSKDKVQIVIFGEDDTDSDSQVSIATFSEDGVLQNWPFGFFNY